MQVYVQVLYNRWLNDDRGSEIRGEKVRRMPATQEAWRRANLSLSPFFVSFRYLLRITTPSLFLDTSVVKDVLCKILSNTPKLIPSHLLFVYCQH